MSRVGANGMQILNSDACGASNVYVNDSSK